MLIAIHCNYKSFKIKDILNKQLPLQQYYKTIIQITSTAYD